MRRKVLQDVANTLSQMLVGWRMGEDFERIADLPDGVLFLELLRGDAAHSIVGPVTLSITGELRSWLMARLDTLSIPVATISEATVQAAIATDRVATNKKRVVSFDFQVSSMVSTAERAYIGKLVERQEWHTRVAS